MLVSVRFSEITHMRVDLRKYWGLGLTALGQGSGPIGAGEGRPFRVSVPPPRSRGRPWKTKEICMQYRDCWCMISWV